MTKSKTKGPRAVVSSKRKAEYKPLLFTTTLRNPQRMRDFLVTLKEFDGEILTDDVCTKVEGELIRCGAYQPTVRSVGIVEKWVSGELLEDSEVRRLLLDNPQNHKEAGFTKGWPSRFDTHFKLAMDLGCVFYKIDRPIRFSEIGNFCVLDQTGYWQEAVYLNGLSKYHRNNPLKRVLNDNRPLSLLLRLLVLLRELNGDDDPGIAQHELALLGVWKNNDADALLAELLRFRKKFGFLVSDEVLFKHCGETLKGWSKKMSVSTVARDLPDDLLRKFRLTGLFVLRGGGRFLGLSTKSLDKAKLVITRHSKLLEFSDDETYFDFVADFDRELIKLDLVSEATTEPNEYSLENWVAEIGESEIRVNLKLLGRRRPSSHPILSLLDEPLRLEFLATLWLFAKLPNVDVRPHYRCDDDGLPLSTAPGGVPDIAVVGEGNSVAVEVTLMRNRQQVHLEMIPIERHLRDLKREFPNASAIFVAPIIHPDAIRYAEFSLVDAGVRIETRSIDQFTDELPGLVTLALG
jgi:hypothetical protein